MKNLINFILILLILVCIDLQGQNDTINQKDARGLKFGFWEEYHENGKIRAVGNYKIIERHISDEEIFFYDLTTTDSIVNRSRKIGIWKVYDNFGKLQAREKYHNGVRYFIEKYSYDENGKLIKTERNGIQTLFGVGKNIEIEQLFYFISGTIGNTVVKYININSLSDQKTSFSIESNSDRIIIREKGNVIEPNARLFIPFTYSIQPDSFKNYIEIVFINPDTNRIRIEVESYGHHLSSHMLQLNNIEVKNFRFQEETLLYLREYEESEMKIFKYGEELSFQKIKEDEIEPLFTFPLSFERNEIDLKNLKKGNYLLTTIDYRNEIEMMIKLIIQ